MNGGMPWTRTTLPFQGAHCLANRSGSLVRLTLQIWSAWGDLHSQGCSGLSRTGLLFPVNHTPVGDPGLAPGRLGDFKSPGSAIPAEASRRELACRAEARHCGRVALLRTACYGAAALLSLRFERRLVGMKGIAPPRLPDSE